MDNCGKIHQKRVEPEDMVKMYQDGMSAREIGKLAGVDYGTVLNVMRRMEVPVRPRGGDNSAYLKGGNGRRKMNAPIAIEMDRGHAGTPGLGPAGATCANCYYLVRVIVHKKKHKKCWLMKDLPAHGYMSGVSSRDQACEFWRPFL